MNTVDNPGSEAKKDKPAVVTGVFMDESTTRPVGLPDSSSAQTRVPKGSAIGTGLGLAATAFVLATGVSFGSYFSSSSSSSGAALNGLCIASLLLGMLLSLSLAVAGFIAKDDVQRSFFRKMMVLIVVCGVVATGSFLGSYSAENRGATEANERSSQWVQEKEAKSFDISYTKTFVKAYLPTYVPQGFTLQRPRYEETSHHVYSWLYRGKVASTSISSYGTVGTVCKNQYTTHKDDVIGQTAAGVAITKQDENFTRYYATKIDDTCIELAVGDHMKKEEMNALKTSEVLQIINSMRPIN